MTVGKKIGLGFSLVLGILLVVDMLAVRGTSTLINTSRWVTHTNQVLERLEKVMSFLKDAETGQRGYVITGDKAYLEPYHNALNEIEPTMTALAEATKDNLAQQKRLRELRAAVDGKLSELKLTIAMRADEGFEKTKRRIQTGLGKNLMNEARSVVDAMTNEEKILLARRQDEADTTVAIALYTIGIGTLAALLLGGLAAFFVVRSIEARAQIKQILESLTESQNRIVELEELLQAGGVPLGELGGYQLLEKLGQGGMGIVYRARHKMLNRMVALKVLPADLMKDTQAVARFRREMRAVGMLDHASIVRAIDAGEADGTHFIAMELVDGMDLAHLTDRNGPLPLPDACEIIRQAAVALQHAHEQGVIHRDLKPSNLMLTLAGQVKVLDLGLARLYSDRALSQELSATGQVMGTPDYMAPEQAFDTQVVDIRVDVYSLGCTLYKLLTGHAPFSGPAYASAMEKLKAHAHVTIPAIRDSRPEVTQELSAVVNRLLAKKPADRFNTPFEVAVALGPFAVGQNLTKLLSEPKQAGAAETVSASLPVQVHAVGAHATKNYLGVTGLPLPCNSCGVKELC